MKKSLNPYWHEKKRLKIWWVLLCSSKAKLSVLKLVILLGYPMNAMQFQLKQKSQQDYFEDIPGYF